MALFFIPDFSSILLSVLATTLRHRHVDLRGYPCPLQSRPRDLQSYYFRTNWWWPGPPLRDHPLHHRLHQPNFRAMLLHQNNIWRSASPHMWSLTAEGMGFQVVAMAWSDPNCAHLMASHGIKWKVLSFGQVWSKNNLKVDLIFSDKAGLVSLSPDYW